MMNKPIISILMPVYNARNTVGPAIWSALNQSFEFFELLIYLDGCTDHSEKVVLGIEDPRITVLKSETNRGIVHARNELVKAASGDYIAWLDADDIWLPGKLAYQYEYMDVHPHLRILGSWVEVRNSKKVKTVKWPSNPDILDSWLFFRNPLVHSSVLIRRGKDDIAYAKEFEYLEDYQFATTYLGNAAISIYPKVLCSYLEVTDNQRIDTYIKYDFVGKLEKIMQRNFALLDLHPGKNRLSLIREFLRGGHSLTAESGHEIFEFLLLAKSQNQKIKCFKPSAFNAVIAWQILRLFKLAKSARLRVLLYFIRRPNQLLLAYRARVKYR